MRYYIEYHNEYLIGRSDSEITAKEIGALNGLKKAEKDYQQYTQRKTHQNYFTDINGESKLAIRKIFTDQLDADGNLVEYKIDFYWYGPVKRLHKQVVIKDPQELDEIQINRRKRIQKLLISEGKNAESISVKLVYTLLLSYLKPSLDLWIATGDCSRVYQMIDEASGDEHPEVLAIFEPLREELESKYPPEDVPVTPKSMKDVFDLFRADKEQAKVKLKDHLKLYIK